jgi:hypothetical protein
MDVGVREKSRLGWEVALMTRRFNQSMWLESRLEMMRSRRSESRLVFTVGAQIGR